jgi:LacI family transcriptional regulator
MRRLGLGVVEGLVVQDLHEQQAVEQATRDLMTLAEPPTALFTAQNYVTVAAVRTLQALGLEQRVALVGFDDFPLAELVRPGVTVIAQDPDEIGRRAAAILFARLAGDDRPPRVDVVPTRLVVRGSGEIGPPPDTA